METSFPHNMTSEMLRRRVRRYNFGYVLLGSTLLAAAFVTWVATVYVSMVSVAMLRHERSLTTCFDSPWLYLDPGSWAVVGGVVAVIAWVGFFYSELFFRVETDADLRAVRDVTSFRWLTPSGWTLILAILCLGPILTWQAVAAFRSRLSLRGARLRLAVMLYQYLDDWGDWVPYPKFESQRQAIILLTLLGLVRVSRRFGKHQVKLVGGRPRWRKGIGDRGLGMG